MRSVVNLTRTILLTLGLGAPVLWAGCATTYGTTGNSVREVEMAHDDGRPADRPILPSGNYELLIKSEPQLNSYRPARLRFLLAQPGQLLFHIYANDPEGRPGKLIYTLSGAYAAPVTSDGKDGKWVVENLPELAPMNGPIWVGVGVPDSSSEARLWVAENDSGHVFQKDTEPQTPLLSSPVHYTPMVRLVLRPE